MESSKFLQLWILDEREYDSPTYGRQFVNCSVKDLEKEDPITNQETVKKGEKIMLKPLYSIRKYINITLILPNEHKETGNYFETIFKIFITKLTFSVLVFKSCESN